MAKMQYVFNPKNRQINPVTPQTIADAALRDKVISSDLYALVCKGKVTLEDISALFAVNRSPEILVKNHTAVKDSPVGKAPENTETLKEDETPTTEPAELSTAGKPDVEAETANAAFDGRALTTKTQAELLILATSAGVDVQAEGFAPTRGNLIKAIMAKAKQASGESDATKAE